MSKKLLQTLAWIAMIAIGLAFLQPLRQVGTPDFMQFYFAGRLAAAGQISRVYDKAAYGPLVEELHLAGHPPNPIGAYFWVRPAFQAFFLVPLSLFSYATAYRLAILGNLALLALLVWKLPIWFPAPAWVRICLAGFLPFLWSIGMGQDTLLLTLLVAYSIRLALQGKETWAGVLLGMGVFKPHLIWGIPLALLAMGRRRAVCAFAAVGIGWAGVSFAAVGVDGIREWMELLELPSTDYRPAVMANLRALGLHFGAVAGAVAALVAVACFGIALCKGSLQSRIAAALLAALLLSPHTYCQDYSLAALAVLLLRHPAGLGLLLLPWPYFYRREDSLPLALLALGFLVILAARPFVAHWWNSPAPASSQPS